MRRASREGMRSFQEEEERRRMQYEAATRGANMSMVAHPDPGDGVCTE